MLGDIRFALRTFAKQPSFVCAAVATLALGIAVNTIVFSLLNSLVLRPMPVRDASRVVRIYPLNEAGRRFNLFSYADFADYRAGSRAFDTLAAYIPVDLTAGRSSLAGVAETPRPALGYVASASYFDITGLRASFGRVLQPSDDRSPERVVVLSHAFWRSRFNADPRAVGASLSLNGTAFTIIGVAEPRFAGTEPLVADVWLPISALNISMPEAPPVAQRETYAFLVVGRTVEGVTHAGAAGGLTVVARRLAAAYPGIDRPAGVEVTRGAFFSLDPGLKPLIAAVMAVVGLVLLIACANVTNLMLARAASRQREIAVRLAIGAGRARIVRQLLVESLVLSLVAGLAALLLAEWALRALYGVGIGLAPFPWTMALNLAPDVRVFAYTLGLAAAGGALLAAAPSLQASSPHIVRSLHGQAVLGGRLRGSMLRRALVVLQVAASVVLLVGAGLLLRALASAEALDLGFSPRGAVYGEYDLRAAGYSAPRASAFNAALVEAARRMPGVTAAAVTSHVPLHGGVRRANVHFGSGSGLDAVVVLSTVSPAYFDVMQVGLVAGRNFSDDELHGPAPVVLISEGLARRFWPGQSAIGKTLTHAKWPQARTVVGVVRDASDAAIWRDKEMAVYLPAQPDRDAADLHVIFRTSADEAAAARDLAAAAARIDPGLRFEASPVSRLLRLWMLPSQVAAGGTAVLAILALLLASIGLYGVLTFTVGQRLRELGIRMALGADARTVVALVLRDGWRMVWRGVAIGGLCATLAAPLLGRMLFGVHPLDPVTMSGVAVVLAAVALAASVAPARRAARLDPLVVLRAE